MRYSLTTLPLAPLISRLFRNSFPYLVSEILSGVYSVEFPESNILFIKALPIIFFYPSLRV